MPNSAMSEPQQKIYKSRSVIFLDNLIGGIAWGVGSVAGAIAVVCLIGFVITQTKSIPFLSGIVSVFMMQIQGK